MHTLDSDPSRKPGPSLNFNSSPNPTLNQILDPSLPRYGSAGILEQWIGEVERDVEELADDTLSVGDIMDASLQR